MSQAEGYTPQQERAIRQRGVSVVLSSGAGCGKTHVLTARYLSHLKDDEADVGQVVAVTFTDRAAREMRDRIRAAIAKRLEKARPEEAARWRRHLRDLETAPISTIHSLCGNLLRQFAVVAGLDPRFEVLEDVLAANIRAEALNTELQALLTSQMPVGEDLRALVVLYGWQATFRGVEELLREYDPPAWESWLAESPERVADDWVASRRESLRPAWVEYLTAGYPAVTRCLTLLRSTPCVGPETRRNVARILEGMAQLGATPEPGALIEELTACARVGKERAKAWPDEDAYAAVRDAFAGFREKLPERMSFFLEEPENLPLAVETGQRFLRVAREAARAYRERKRWAGAVDFQDLLVLTRDLLRDHDEAREALQQRFRFVLLDELQDTDPVQMELVELLCSPVGMRHGKLFAVGDHKQSIYRFRGADVELFEKLRGDVAEEGRLSLRTNFRSQPAILHFVNALCGKRFARYEPLAAHHPALHDGACVEFLWTVPENDEAKVSVPDLRRREADAIASRLATLLDDPRPRVLDPKAGGLRRVRPADVALLFRSMSNVGVYEAALRRWGLDYYLVGGRAFFAQQEVYDLLNLLRCLENPQDAVSLAGTLRSPFCCLSDEALFVLGLHPEGLWAGLHDEHRFRRLPADQQAAVLRARRHLVRWQARKDRLPIARLLGQVLADSGYDAALQFEFLGDRKLANLWKLIDMARSFDRSGVFGLADFIRQLGDQVERQPREEQAATQPENADVIKLMSIHQSKGLEFPVVIVPDLAAAGRSEQFPVARWHRTLGCLVRPPVEDDPPPFSDFGWRLGRAFDTLAEWGEDLRILYVACTRARDLLILSASFAEPLPGGLSGRSLSLPAANTWIATLQERFHLLTGQCLADDVAPEDRPQVRVTVASGRPAVEPAAGSSASGAERLEALREEPTGRVAPGLLPERAVVSLATLEWFDRLGDQGGEHARDLFSSGPAAELPSDALAEGATVSRSRWHELRDRLGGIGSPEAERDALLRAVLSRWELNDQDGWQELLLEAIEVMRPEGSPARLTEELAPLLRAFADSDVRGQLRAAPVCCRDVEFIVDGRAALESLDVPEAGRDIPFPYLRGVIDFLWQDRSGGWHVLAVEPGEERFRRDAWYGRKPFLLIQAWAVREQLGRAPASVTLFDLSEGRVEQSDARRVRYGQAFSRVRDILHRLVRGKAQSQGLF